MKEDNIGLINTDFNNVNADVELFAAIEALLFAAGESLTSAEIAGAIDVEEGRVLRCLTEMSDFYSENPSGIMLRELSGGYVLCTKPQYDGYIRTLSEPKIKKGLSQAALEALAVTAYNQPVTRAKVEEIRGVNSDGAMTKLLERGLIEESGRMDVPGRPGLFRTTELFLKNFGLASLDDLPDLTDIITDDKVSNDGDV